MKKLKFDNIATRLYDMKPRVKVLQVDPKTNKGIKVFNSISQAAYAMGIAQTNISDVLAGRQKTAAGFKWIRIK